MTRTARSAYPLHTLREAIQGLEAAILVCLAKPRKKAVHRLRTTTRRIEAQLELLAILPNLPPHHKETRKARRLLRKLRRAAGQVRDLDVQRALIADEATGRNGGSRSTPELRKEAAKLRRMLKRKRDHEAAHLQHLLHKHRTDFPAILERLVDTLGPSESIALSETALTGLIRNWYAQHTSRPALALDQPAQLHHIRKHAKLARYLAESAPQSAAIARRMAAHFGDLQQAGGKWHDWLLLHDLAASELGKRATLPQRFATHAENSLRAFKRLLAGHSSRPVHAKAA